MTRQSWASSGARRAAAGRRAPRPAESFGLAVDRARGWWDGLADGPAVRPTDGRQFYSDVAAAAILALAVELWADTAAALDDAGDG